jgi:hypothetical protein
MDKRAGVGESRQEGWAGVRLCNLAAQGSLPAKGSVQAGSGEGADGAGIGTAGEIIYFKRKRLSNTPVRGTRLCLNFRMSGAQTVSAHKRRTRAEVQELVAEFMSSGMPRSEFCRSVCRALVKNRRARRTLMDGRVGCILVVSLIGLSTIRDALMKRCDISHRLASLANLSLASLQTRLQKL